MTATSNGGAVVRKSSLGTSSVAKGLMFSGVACCVAEGLTFPIDVIKTRLQLQGELGATRVYSSSLDAVRVMAKTEGVGVFYQGLFPALLRQATYGTLRYGLYEPIKNILGQGGVDPVTGRPAEFPLWKKIIAGTASGAISSAMCNPTDLVKVRMQADVRVPGVPPRYGSTFEAFRAILREEGWAGLYRGVGPTCSRAAVGAATELATYDELKQRLLLAGVPDGLKAHVGASLAAGFITTLATSPFDVIKSRMMNQTGAVKAGGGGGSTSPAPATAAAAAAAAGLSPPPRPYSGMLDCASRSVRSEGVLSLWKGFWPNYARIGPRVVIIFLLLENLRKTFDA